MNFRKLIFWTHLVAGLVAGIVVLIMSVTGVALMYERQMLEWADKKQVEAPAGAERLSLEALIAKVRATETNAPTAITLAADPTAPTVIAFGREKTLHINPYTGESLGEGAKGIRSFFQSMILWHRWLGTEGEGRAIGKAITGACNLAFLFLVVSGFYLWWPKKLRWNIVKGIVTFNGKLTGRARDWNWHNVIGFWSAIPLFFVVLTAVFFSYTWATPLLYKAFGEEPPAPRSGPPGGPSGVAAATGSGGSSTNAVGRAEGREGRPAGERGGGEGRPSGEGRRAEGGGRASANAPAEVTLAGLDQLWAKAEKHNPNWETISFRVPTAANAPAVFSIAESHRGRPDLRSTLTLNWQTGEVVSEEKYADYSPARKARTWVRYIHTGEAGGFIGQTIAGAVSAGGAVLVWTGIALSLRRFAGWRRKRAEGAETANTESEKQEAEVAKR